MIAPPVTDWWPDRQLRKHLLRSYNLKLNEIAARCGYPDAPCFCRVFKRLSRMTPVEYRAKASPLTCRDQ